jgi:hypothetical protein
VEPTLPAVPCIPPGLGNPLSGKNGVVPAIPAVVEAGLCGGLPPPATPSARVLCARPARACDDSWAGRDEKLRSDVRCEIAIADLTSHESSPEGSFLRTNQQKGAYTHTARIALAARKVLATSANHSLSLQSPPWSGMCPSRAYSVPPTGKTQSPMIPRRQVPAQRPSIARFWLIRSATALCCKVQRLHPCPSSALLPQDSAPVRRKPTK